MREVPLPDGRVLVHGHWGRPVLIFPSEQGNAHDAESNGLVGAVSSLLEAGRVKLYCVDSYDAASWSANNLPLEERARAHERYDSWITSTVAGFIASDSGGEIITAGCSMGAYHALNTSLRHADVFPLALCFSGNYDVASWQFFT